MKEHTLPEKNGHVVYYTEHGNPNGPAVVSFHGGPGDGSKPRHAERFDLETYRVILFDQRGTGNSTPLGETAHNTTQDVIFDTERIREALGIEEWFVSGSSWGATCALLYAIAHPKRTRGLLLSSVFMAHSRADEWFMGSNGAAILTPDVWKRRMAFFDKHNIRLSYQHEDLLKLFEKGDIETQQEITAGVFDWEGNIFHLGSGISYTDPTSLDERALAVVHIFLTYASNRYFIDDDYILKNVEQIQDIPTVIVHGRYDLICPASYMYELTQGMSQCEVIFADASGHRLTAEANTIRKLAFDRFLERRNKDKKTT